MRRLRSPARSRGRPLEQFQRDDEAHAPAGSIEVAEEPPELLQAVVEALPPHAESPGGLGDVELRIEQGFEGGEQRAARTSG